MEGAQSVYEWPDQLPHAALARFVCRANEQMAIDPDSGFFSLHADFEELVFSSDLLPWLANRELARIKRDNQFDSPMWGPNSILIAGNENWQLRAGLYTRSADFIYTLPYHFMVAAVSGGTLEADIYELPQDLINDIFSPTLRLEPGRHVQLERGSVLVLDNRRQLLDVVISTPILAVKFCGNFNNPLQWAFDRSTLLALQAIAANAGDSELVSMARTLGALQNKGGESALLDLARHPRHFVRWAALQGLARVSPEIAFQHLQSAACNDLHPHIRNAAERTLRQLEGTR